MRCFTHHLINLNNAITAIVTPRGGRTRRSPSALGSRRRGGRRTTGRAAVALLAAWSLVAVTFPGAVFAVTPTPGVLVSATLYPINVSTTVDAYDPHVSGDLAAYTADAKIRYYDFFLGNDSQVPSPSGAIDFLSDVSAGRIVFSRFGSGNSRIMVFDTSNSSTTEIDPQPSPYRSSAKIDFNTIAFIDQTSPTGDLYASFLGGATHQVTNDGRVTREPSVAPLGNVIVYESCASNATDCSIRQAAWNGSAWQVTNLTEDGTEAEANPDTDGVVVVYDADRGGNREIAWQPVGGGTEQVLTISGSQFNPSVNSGIVAFESVAPGDVGADIFVYDIANNRLFQVTATAGVAESLNDVFVLPNGNVRVVWAEGPGGDRDVRGADLELPPVGPTYAFGGFSSRWTRPRP